jgi:hypothetical protein
MRHRRAWACASPGRGSAARNQAKERQGEGAKNAKWRESALAGGDAAGCGFLERRGAVTVIGVSPMMGSSVRFGNRWVGIVLAAAAASFTACASEGEKAGTSEPVDDWKCGTDSSISGFCACNTPTEKAGRMPTRDCNSDEYVCCTYREGLDWKSCSCHTGAALAERGHTDCAAFAEEFSASEVDSCPP